MVDMSVSFRKPRHACAAEVGVNQVHLTGKWEEGRRQRASGAEGQMGTGGQTRKGRAEDGYRGFSQIETAKAAAGEGSTV